MKLVDDWKQARHWASMWWSGSGLAFHLVAAALVKGISISVAFVGYVPLVWLPAIGAGISALTLAARVTKQKPKKPRDPNTFGIGG